MEITTRINRIIRREIIKLAYKYNNIMIPAVEPSTLEERIKLYIYENIDDLVRSIIFEIKISQSRGILPKKIINLKLIQKIKKILN